MGKGRRAGGARHAVFGITAIVSSALVGDGYRDGHAYASCRVRTLNATLQSQVDRPTVPQRRSATGVPLDGTFFADHHAV